MKREKRVVRTRFLIDKKYYQDRSLQRGDIVVFQSHLEPSLDFIKRVVGLPGDILEIVNHKVFIDKEILTEPYINAAKRYDLFTKRNLGPLNIPDDGVFVLGDNRGASHDSRHYKFVQLSAIRGKALYILWAEDYSRIGINIE